MIDPVTFILLTLATMLIARTVTEEEIFKPFLAWIVKVNGATGKITYLVHCPVCMSFWASAAVTTAWAVATHANLWLAAITAFAAAEVAPRVLAWNPGFKGK